MALPQKNIYTIEDIYALPNGQRAELIDGQMYMMAPPSTGHQRIVFSLSRKIADYIDSKGGRCEVFPAPFAVFLNVDEQNYVEPDISVICNKDKLSERGCEGSPDFIIEVVSPGSRKMDYSKKMTLYSESGVLEYWIVDPEKERTTVYHFEEDDAPFVIPFAQSIQAGIYKDLQINISELL
ncbi:MAG: Uma2 family endonuclease [Lachnospiraceae bacterium]|nr:Uma2 family endonuclease [Lachnospiraceae bacterium]